MGRNSPAEQVWHTNIAVPGVGNTLYLDDEEAERYNADPDAYAASQFGLSKIEYLQWVELEGGAALWSANQERGFMSQHDWRLSIAGGSMEGSAPQAVLHAARRRVRANVGANWPPHHAVDLFFGLRGESPENGSFLEFDWRLSGILCPKSANVSLQRLLAMRKARISRAFLIMERKFSENKNAWLGQKDSNLRMVESKAVPSANLTQCGLVVHHLS
jgi:hypothetical protein